MVTSLRKEDFLGRNLTNGTPGTTDPVRDYNGRITTATVDYLGRALTVAPWAAETAYALGATVWITGAELVCTTAGTSDEEAPAAPGSIGGTVVDATVTWTRSE